MMTSLRPNQIKRVPSSILLIDVGSDSWRPCALHCSDSGRQCSATGLQTCERVNRESALTGQAAQAGLVHGTLACRAGHLRQLQMHAGVHAGGQCPLSHLCTLGHMGIACWLSQAASTEPMAARKPCSTDSVKQRMPARQDGLCSKFRQKLLPSTNNKDWKCNVSKACSPIRGCSTGMNVCWLQQKYMALH